MLCQEKLRLCSCKCQTALSELYCLSCFFEQSVVRKMSPTDAPKISDQIMTALLHMFENTSGKSGNVQEDALVAVSTLCEGKLIFFEHNFA